MSVANFRCRNHPDRPGIGLCVTCRASVCAECTTKVQGVNTCLQCLSLRVQKSDTRRVRRVPTAAAFLAIPLSLGFFWLAFFALGLLFAEL